MNKGIDSKNSVSSLVHGSRQSNFELLRLFAMLLVLVVHADFWTLGRPTIASISESSFQSFTKVAIESIAVVCVNCFILISGWFGIRATWKGGCGFIFQCLYFIIGFYIIALSQGWSSLSLNKIWECLLLTPNSWFIHSYIGLYILSPILNAFLEKTPKKTVESILILFFLYQSTFGWLNGAQYFMGGYSAISFCGLYLLAGYVKRYLALLNFIKIGGGIYICSIFINIGLYYAVTLIGFPIDVYAYCNPFVIAGALGLLLWFNKITIRPNILINRLAMSAFAVYLFHTETNVGVKLFKTYVLRIFDSYSGLSCILLTGLLLLSFYVVAILIDQPRYYIWGLLSRRVFST